MTPEEEAAMDAMEIPQAELDRMDWEDKHARCDACGQFLKKRPPLDKDSPFIEFLERERGRNGDWIGHYVQDYWGEWDHV